MNEIKEIEIPLLEATNENLKGYGYLIDNYDESNIEIVTWPKQGWREIDEGTGNEGGITQGSFEVWWDDKILYGKNNAVQHKSEYEIDGKYILGYSSLSQDESKKNVPYVPPKKIYMWHANYHPDGGQLFFPTQNKPFISPLALPGDDIKAEHFKAFYFDGKKGLYIHPDIWHEGVFSINKKSSFKGKQGKVHARVSIDFKKEFNKYIYFKTELPGQ